MAIKISSILLNAGRDDDRVSGLLRNDPSLVVVGGMVITQDPSAGPSGEGKTFKLFDGSAAVSGDNPLPWGLVIEATHGYPGGGASGDTAAGRGFDNLFPVARGGVYSAFHRPGNIVDVLDDQTDTTQVTVNAGQQNASAPFVVNDSWAVGIPVFADANGLLTITNAAGAGGAQIGTVRAVNGSGADLILAIELGIAIAAS